MRRCSRESLNASVGSLARIRVVQKQHRRFLDLAVGKEHRGVDPVRHHVVYLAGESILNGRLDKL
jgi:hypothetical protein